MGSFSAASSAQAHDRNLTDVFAALIAVVLISSRCQQPQSKYEAKSVCNHAQALMTDWRTSLQKDPTAGTHNVDQREHDVCGD